MKNLMKILGVAAIIVLLGAVISMQIKLNKQLRRIDVNVQELISDVYQRQEQDDADKLDINKQALYY